MSAPDPLVPDLDDYEDGSLATSTQDSVNDGTSTIGAENEGSNKFQKAITAWRNVDLINLIPMLDSTASELVTHQRDSLVERKDLAQKTKDWRKLDDEAKLAESKALLKAYQTYIDLISNHSKTVQSAFLNVYSSLSEAPDPYPLLEASVDSLIMTDETVPKLEAENKQLKNTTSRLTTQLEALEKQLEAERTARSQVEDNRDAKLIEIETKWSAVLKEKQDNWEAREKSFEEKAVNSERLFKELKANHEVSQRLERGDESNDNQYRAITAELEIVSSDLERANSRIAEVESRNEKLRIELAQASTQSSTENSRINIEDNPAFLRLRSENSSLLRKVETARWERESENRKYETNTRNLKKETTALKNDTETMKAKLAKCSDYEDIKRELEVLKSIEFATGDNDEVHQATEESSSQFLSKDKDQDRNLEQLLLARNKKLNNELTVLRVSHQDLTSKLEVAQNDLSRTNKELEKSRNLTVTLENDLSKMQNEVTDTRPAMSVAGTYSSRYPVSSFQSRRGLGRVSPTSSIISGIEPSQNDGLRPGDAMGGGSGILPMITAQRDRFKKRISELEVEGTKNYQIITSLRSEIASLQKDNLNLYEKTRYVSTYKHQPSTSPSTYPTNPESTSAQVVAPLDKYKSAYESQISPFAAFRGRESARAFKRMSLPERAFLQITKVVLATRTSRNLFALYCLLIHVLLFAMMFHGSTPGMSQQHISLPDNAVSVADAAAAAAKAAIEADEAFKAGG